MRIDSSTCKFTPPAQPTPPAATAAPVIAPIARAAAMDSRSLRVLLVVESSGAGTGRHVLDLAEGLLRRGCDVHLIYSTGRIDRMFRDRMAEVHGLKSLPLHMRTNVHLSDWRVVKAVKRYMHEFGPFDVIHGHSSKGGAVARLAAIGTRAAAFYTLHGLIMMDPSLARWKRLFYLTVEWGLSLRTSKIIAVSPEEARAARRVGLGQSRVVLVPNGVGPARLTPRTEARRELGLGDDALAIGFVGRLVDQKAPHILLEAFASTVKVAPHARLVIVGGGPLMEPMRQLSHSLGIADQVMLLGERDARGVLAAFDIFAMSSRKEGLPYVLLEALAAGLPIVATVDSGVEIIIEHGVNGAVVPTDDAQSFSAALIALALDPARVVSYGAASLRRSSEFTLDAMMERTIATYCGASVFHG